MIGLHRTTGPLFYVSCLEALWRNRMASTVSGFSLFLRASNTRPAELNARSLEALVAGMQSTALAKIERRGKS